MVFVIINTDVEGLFHSYSVPAGTCIAFCNIFTDGGFFFLHLNLETEANTLALVGLFNYFRALVHVEGMEEKFLLHSKRPR